MTAHGSKDHAVRILQVSVRASGGGAENIARSLHDGYRAAGHEAWLAVKRRYAGDDDPSILVIPNDAARGAWARFWLRLDEWAITLPDSARRLRTPLRQLSHAVGQPGRAWGALRGHEDFDFPGAWRLPDLPPHRPEVLHCHNLHGGFFDLQALPNLSRRVPTVLTMHDAWLLSGHCAHSFDCERWAAGCGNCPYLGTYPAVARDATAFNWRRKAAVYERSKLYVVTPSEWLMAKVNRSMLVPALAGARVIPNGVDLSRFNPGDRAAARAALDLPLGTDVLLFVAAGATTNPFKDFATLREAVARVSTAMPDRRLVFLGVGSDLPAARVGRAELRFVPFVKDPESIVRLYRAADVYLHAAKADTFPTTVLEALACGTPVVATAVGGIPEQVDHGHSGFLVPPGDPEAMAWHIRQVLADRSLLARMQGAAVDTAVRGFDRDEQVRRYLSWFGEITTHHRGDNSASPRPGR